MEGLFTEGVYVGPTVVESVVCFVGQICNWVNLLNYVYVFGEDIRVVASGG